MASVYRKNDSWYLRYRDHRGRWCDRASKAKTKTEAKRMASDMERQAERQRLGLEPLPVADGGGTVMELLRWWLETYSAGLPSHHRNVLAIEKHFASSELADVTLADLTAGKVELFLQKRSSELAPETINHLRQFLRTAINRAIEADRWPRANPVARVKRRKIPKRKPDFLRVDEVPLLLKALTQT